ncbi:MAG: LPS export ABC transporter permease LptG [Luteimonas sp.]
MRPGPRIHTLYVARTVAVTVLLTWTVLVGLDVINGLVNEFGDIGKGNYGMIDALTYVLYSIPGRLYTLFPTSAVIGALMGLGQLAASSELTALRALGLSRRRLSASVAAPLLALTALMMLSGETVGPWAQRSGDGMKAAARSKEMTVAQYSGLWAREGNIFLNARSGQEHADANEAWLELNDVRLFEFAANGRLESIAQVGAAEHRKGDWLLRNVKRTYFEVDSVTQTEVIEERWESMLDASALAASARNIWRPRYMASRDLRTGIDYRQRNSLDASEFEEHYWGRWFYPLNVLALCLAAIPFAFGSLRSGGAGKRLFIGIVFALGFWLLQIQFVQLAGVYKFDYRLAYMVSPLVMLTVSFFLFRRRSG